MNRKKLAIIVASSLMMSCTFPVQTNEQASQCNVEQLIETAPIAADGGELRFVDFTHVARNCKDAVVHIKTELTKRTPLYENFFGMIINKGVQDQTYTAFGSGVVIEEDGYIITNNHVVQDAERITVTMNDKRTFSAKLVGNDPSTDLALIKIEAVGLQRIPWGNSDGAEVGEWVLAIGNPFNLTSTVTAGIISAKARYMDIIENTNGMESPIESFIQTDAAVNSGNSGGAMVDAEGKLIGIITAIASGNGYYTGYSFAIPSNLAHKVALDLKKYGYVQRAYLGVSIAEVDSRLAEYKGLKEIKGVYIGRVLKNGAAYNAGLRDGDIILAINGVATNSYAELMEEMGKYSPGDEIVLTYDRNSTEHQAKARLLNLHGNTTVQKKERSETFDMYGAKFAIPTVESLHKMNLKYGVEVVNTGRSFLSSIGVRSGFIITSVDGKPMRTQADIDKIRTMSGKLMIEGYYKGENRKYYYILEV
ncbi:MAG: trypsin-like peptidase domain-containing protein [Bacteroidales bacterium]|nr:trypsin-like peptidase domain-containing protein [Bacteroidales bacterium]